MHDWAQDLLFLWSWRLFIDGLQNNGTESEANIKEFGPCVALKGLVNNIVAEMALDYLVDQLNQNLVGVWLS